jgi:hypothetical protein
MSTFWHAPASAGAAGDEEDAMEFDLRSRWRRALVIAAAVLTAGLATAESGTIASRTFEVTGRGLLKVGSDLGSVKVESGSTGRVTAEVTYDTRGIDRHDLDRFLEGFKVSFAQDGNNVTVTAENAERGWSWWSDGRSRPAVTFTFVVPRAFDVSLETGGGTISVADLDGTVTARTSGGSLNFGSIAGPVTGRTSGGSIALDGCSGDADVATSGGSITIGEVKGRVKAHTSGGGIRVDAVAGDIDASTSGGSIHAHITEQPRGDCRLTTSGGSVTVHLFQGIAVDIDARGSWVRSELPVTMTVSGEVRHDRMRGTINGGGPQLYLCTSGGGVRILRD